MRADHDDDFRSGTRSQLHFLQGRPLFFPFVSGTLAYSCATCDAPCCKGQPIGIGRSRELVTIQQAQPRATLFSAPGFRGGPLLSLLPPPEKCWFLDRKNRCRLEHVLGRDSKPTGCKLFPFSTLAGAGEVLVVLPDLLCPITLQTTENLSPQSSHDALTWELRESQVPRGGHRELTSPPDLSWDEALPLERRIVEEAAVVLGSPVPLGFYGPFADLQHQLTVAFSGADSKPGAMATLEHDIRRFLAVNESPSPEGVREIVGLTGTLRMSEMGAAPHSWPVPRRALPSLLVALSVVAGTFEHMRGSKRSLRSLLSVWSEQGPLLYALAHLGARPLPLTKTSLDDATARLGQVRPALLEVIEGIRNNGKRSLSLTVEELLRKQREAFAPPLTADAVAMLHALGRVLRDACTFTPI